MTDVQVRAIPRDGYWWTITCSECGTIENLRDTKLRDEFPPVVTTHCAEHLRYHNVTIPTQFQRYLHG